MPFLRRVVYEIRPYYTQKDRYFQWRNELHTIKAEEELLMEHDRTKGHKFRAEHLSEIRLLGRLEAVDKRRRALEKDRKEALLNGDEVEARRIEGEIGRVLGRFNKEAESLKGPAHAPDRQSNSQAFQ